MNKVKILTPIHVKERSNDEFIFQVRSHVDCMKIPIAVYPGGHMMQYLHKPKKDTYVISQMKTLQDYCELSADIFRKQQK